ncbi:heme lyase CcmF/NrfE family subunit [Pleionea sp. CnH1-48]|uniref:heme lyase CcmF/NrfE family subunit n=1 Tax=Pleionea sp. CnH1-48 TaxID=2954494 RepID=UPI002097F07E|nr:heme lyase CcmF/NrfE family subunit [Pleionea sp. CnH1-48]MCO7223614.1 heme lyase CcmF/NrfE family subunit [Pleionea sp. CnH1-48]
MIIELGFFSLVFALMVALFLFVLPMIGSMYAQSSLIRFARPAALVLFVLVLGSFLALVYGFLTDDFTVRYIYMHSNSRLPDPLKVSAVWGAHEGSMLLWILMLTMWTAAVAIFSRRLPDVAVARVLSVMGFITSGFIAFAVFTSNPFERVLPYFPVDGNELNPLLQDFGLIVHPPMLYMGYVGFSVAFAFAIAALLSGELDSTWARWSRPWTTAAWAFLTVGIALGSWWAYYELGWGGWWFWDPVENASFMPWLAGTALIHSLAVSEKRGTFKTWTVFLALATFSLSLLGAFLVRSGVITSVHSFAQDPVRGLYLLIFLGIVVSASLLLFIFRGGVVKSTGNFEAPLSREFMLLSNNILLCLALLVVFLGTLFPLFMEAFADQSVSVGPPFYNLVFPIVMAPLLILMAIGPLLHWKKYSAGKLIKQLRWIFLIVIILAIGFYALYIPNETKAVWIGLLLSFWVISGLLYDIMDKAKNSRSLVTGLRKLKPSFWGMQLAHLGIAVSTIGIMMVTFFSEETLVRLKPDESFRMGQYEFTFRGIRNLEGPNYLATRGIFEVTDGHENFALFPEKRQYLASRQVMTEAAIDPALMRDVYISLGEPLDNQAWSVRIYVKSFVRWIWLGAIFMALGGFLAISDKRYRLKARRKEALAAA